MINVYDNFRNGNINMWCKTCFVFPETQKHLINCSPIQAKLEQVIDFSTVQYEHISGTDSEQENIVKIYTLILKMRDDILLFKK